MHPPLEDGSRTFNILESFFHISILVPQLVDARENRNSPIKKVPSVVDLRYEVSTYTAYSS